jgi:hypothetical protein
MTFWQKEKERSIQQLNANLVTQKTEFRDGISYEGPGIPPDIYVKNTMEEMEAGLDKAQDAGTKKVHSLAFKSQFIQMKEEFNYGLVHRGLTWPDITSGNCIPNCKADICSGFLLMK